MVTGTIYKALEETDVFASAGIRGLFLCVDINRGTVLQELL